MWWLSHHTRNFFRSFMRPVPENVAKKWHKRMQFLYVFVAMNFAGYAYYKYTHSSIESNLSEQEKFERKARQFNAHNAKMYKFKNGTLTKYEVDLTKE